MRQARQAAEPPTASEPAPVEAAEEVDPESLVPSATALAEWVGTQERVARTLREARAARNDPGRASEMEPRLSQELERAPDLVSLHVEMAHLLRTQARNEESAHYAMQALQKDPDRADAALLLAEALVELNQHDAALHVARHLVQLDPLSMDGHRLAKRAYLANRQPGPAIQHIEKLLSSDPGNHGLRNQLALAHASLGDVDKGIDILQTALRRDPGNQAAHFYLATLQARKEQAAEAVDTLSRAAREFGYPFVATWLESGEFDGIREEVVFARFRALTRSLSGGPPSDEAPEPGIP